MNCRLCKSKMEKVYVKKYDKSFYKCPKCSYELALPEEDDKGKE